MIFRLGGLRETTLRCPGLGLEVYFQGCSKRCVGCHNPELQGYGGLEYDTEIIFINIKVAKLYDSLIFLGGEPLEQMEAVRELMNNSGLYNILYTGWEYEEIPGDIRQVMDMIISGPYIEELATNDFPASANQKVTYKER